ncbi:MAG TPA: hypothetical protein VNJ54_15225 [Plantibacter sp.]|uniref:hypothetical protein n=1 Tax=Plantibacter sp. TaxID=1871045 RepID=UPI002C9F16E0|nr:hypothetical protein [Plantibacter sp.]
MPHEQQIMVDRVDPTTGQPEAEMVVATVRDGHLLLVLDDGGSLSMDAGELAAVLKAAA